MSERWSTHASSAGADGPAAELARSTFACEGSDIDEVRLLAQLAAPGRRLMGLVRFILGRLVGAGLVDVSALPDLKVAAVGRVLLGCGTPGCARRPASRSANPGTAHRARPLQPRPPSRLTLIAGHQPAYRPQNGFAIQIFGAPSAW